MMKLLRTPQNRFADLPDYPFAPHYLTVTDRWEQVGIRIHTIDEGDSGAQVVLMLHGEPSWSFLYRKMVTPFVEAGYRVLAARQREAVDNQIHLAYIGFDSVDSLLFNFI